MKKWLWMLALAAGVGFTLAPAVSEAKRLGGGKAAGMQRSSVLDKPAQPQPASPAATPNTPAAPAAAAAPVAGATAAAAAAPKRSWMGPIAGLAAGLGLAALFSHLGLGEELASFLMLALLALVAFFVLRMLMRRFASGAAMPRSPLATAGAGAGGGVAPVQPVVIGSALKAPLAAPGLGGATTAPSVPAGFDAEGFERLARMLFIRMQAANDRADLDDLRNFTTPELFASLRLDLQDRGDARQTTDVVKVDASLVDFAQEGERLIVSVRFNGMVREAASAEAVPFDEVWHLVKPIDDSRSWTIAGIQPRAQ